MKRTYFYVLTFICVLSLHNATLRSSHDLADAVQEKTPRHEYILQLISHGANPNITVNGCPLIIYVTMKLVRKKTADDAKWYQLLETLLTHKAKVDDLDTNRYTALMYAAYYGHYDAVALLLAHHAHAGFCNAYGKSPITEAQDGRAFALNEKQKEQYTKIIALLTTYTKKRK